MTWRLFSLPLGTISGLSEGAWGLVSQSRSCRLLTCHLTVSTRRLSLQEMPCRSAEGLTATNLVTDSSRVSRGERLVPSAEMGSLELQGVWQERADPRSGHVWCRSGGLGTPGRMRTF